MLVFFLEILLIITSVFFVGWEIGMCLAIRWVTSLSLCFIKSYEKKGILIFCEYIFMFDNNRCVDTSRICHFVVSPTDPECTELCWLSTSLPDVFTVTTASSKLFFWLQLCGRSQFNPFARPVASWMDGARQKKERSAPSGLFTEELFSCGFMCLWCPWVGPKLGVLFGEWWCCTKGPWGTAERALCFAWRKWAFPLESLDAVTEKIKGKWPGQREERTTKGRGGHGVVEHWGCSWDLIQSRRETLKVGQCTVFPDF